MAKKQHKKDPKKWNIIRGRKGRTHITRCGEGYLNASKNYREVHHVVCVNCVADATISDMLKDDEALERIRNCLAETNWNINDSHNTVGLPKKPAFPKKPSSDWNGWPCHQVDHNVKDGYTDRVSVDLKDNVWDPALKVSKKCKFEPKDLAEQLKQRSKFWFRFLSKRGKGNRGTAYCWENRMKIERGKIALPKPWYYPFSMHPSKPTRRMAPPSDKDFSAGMKAALEKLFNSL